MSAIHPTGNRSLGSLAHAPPEPTQAEREAQRQAQARQAAVQPEELPAKPVVHQQTKVLLMPTGRFDGSSEDPPWFMPEPVLWDLLRKTEIEHIEERALDGLSGSFWVRYRNYDGQLRSGLLKFSGLGRDYAYETWGDVYRLDAIHYDLLRREQAAYEVGKAFGMEDIVPPQAAREVNLVPLISDAVRERIASALRIAPNAVDEQFGTVGLLQMLPYSAVNFVDHWAMLGPDSAARWNRASDRMRHSVYRAIAFEFLVGIADRLLCSLLYNRSLDAVVLYNNDVVFPDSARLADGYLATRAKGWGKRVRVSTENPSRPGPAHGADLMHLAQLIQDANTDECVDTFRQIADGVSGDMMVLLGQVLVEHAVPKPCIAGIFARLVFLEQDPYAVLTSPEEFVQNVLVPMRRGYGFDEGRNRQIVAQVSELMTAVTGKAFDFSVAIQTR